ncbi:MAG: DNA polymerase III subunit gamma/tau [Clostridiales bacterium]|nr:DNA polymerase III subunit gamma/tau [Clostridiales bacterium]
MAYTSLYRKYRPQTFDAMIGQHHIRQTLKNVVLTGNIAHAYLFTGSRGTGKTSTAKVFAKAINCLHPKEDGSPCCECAVCKTLSKENNLDIIELDAASNNSVENIRSVVEKVNYAPTAGKYKVYIIDEVHMLSASAFNAFLKTLEEPPEHVVFILATTDVQKLPATIISRCLRFDFRLIPNDELIAHLKYIFNQEGKRYEDEALAAIAEAGNGSARDTLSIADMVLSYCGDNIIDYKSVLEVLGASSPENIYEICDNIVMGRVDKALALTNKLINLGKDVRVIASDLAKMLNNILYIKNCQDAKDVLSVPSELYLKMKDTSISADNSKIYRSAEIFALIDNSLRYSSQPKVVLEASVAKACDISTSIDDATISRRVADLEAFKRTFQGMDTKEGTTVTARKIWGDLMNFMTTDKSTAHYERMVCEDAHKDANTKIELVNKEIWISTKNDQILNELLRYKSVILREIQAFYPEIQVLKITKEVEKLEETMNEINSLFDKSTK